MKKIWSLDNVWMGYARTAVREEMRQFRASRKFHKALDLFTAAVILVAPPELRKG